MTQNVLIVLILAVCVLYTANCIYKTYRKAKTCKDYKCANCPFLEQCEKKKSENKGKTVENRLKKSENKGKTVENKEKKVGNKEKTAGSRLKTEKNNKK